MVHDALCNCAQCNGMQHTMECMVAKWRLMIEARKSEIGGSGSNGKVLDLNHNDRHNLHHHVLAHVNECCKLSSVFSQALVSMTRPLWNMAEDSYRWITAKIRWLPESWLVAEAL